MRAALPAVCAIPGRPVSRTETKITSLFLILLFIPCLRRHLKPPVAYRSLPRRGPAAYFTFCHGALWLYLQTRIAFLCLCDDCCGVTCCGVTLLLYSVFFCTSEPLIPRNNSHKKWWCILPFCFSRQSLSLICDIILNLIQNWYKFWCVRFI